MKRWWIVPVALVIAVLPLWCTRRTVPTTIVPVGTEDAPVLTAPDELLPAEPLPGRVELSAHSRMAN